MDVCVVFGEANNWTCVVESISRGCRCPTAIQIEDDDDNVRGSRQISTMDDPILTHTTLT